MITKELVKKTFPKISHGNIDKYFNVIYDTAVEYGLDDDNMFPVLIGTIRAETEGFKPISEYPSIYNTEKGGKPFAKYDFRKDIGNNAIGDGDKYKGRGFIQLTGKANYMKYGKALGVDLIKNPELANDAVIASRILCLFIKDKECKIRELIANANLKGIRKLVNGGTHGIDRFVETYTYLIKNTVSEVLK